MNKIIPYLVLLLSMPCFVKANTDTLFISSKGQIVDAQNAEYFQVNQDGGQKKYSLNQYWMDGTLKMEVETDTLPDWKMNGFSAYYWRNGKIKNEGFYLNDRRSGSWNFYDSLGRLTRESLFVNGSLNDTEKRYDVDKHIISAKYVYKNGDFVVAYAYDNNGKECEIKENMPPFPETESLNAVNKILAQNIKYPEADRDAGIQGKVKLRLIIDETGKLKDCEVIKSVSVGCDNEAIRMINMISWKPVLLDGKPAICTYVIRISFRLE